VFGVVELQQASAAGGSRFKGWLHSKQQPGYNVIFVTSNIWGAGTGSKVFFELVGEHGTTGELLQAHSCGFSMLQSTLCCIQRVQGPDDHRSFNAASDACSPSSACF
jgi:hypothetical protein